jgi:acyl-CoA synthetase (AMP-forming)/AMP-acid ligase II
LTFTSGSTGDPRAAVRTHGFLLAQHRVLDRSLRLKAGEVDLTTMPIVLLANLASGVTSLIADADLRRPGAIDPAPVVAQLQRYPVVSTAASPAFLERLAKYCSARGLTLPGLRKVFTGGAPVFPHVLEQVQRMAPDAEVTAVYGSTEAEPIAHIAYHEIADADRKAMLAGRGLLAGVPVPEIRVRILSNDGGPGEIAVSGEHVLPGYLHGQGDSETKFREDGVVWHRTGDAGYLDDRGRLWLLGRCCARIEDRHGVLYPFAAETAVYQDARVRRAALVAHEGRRVLALEFWDGRAEPDREMLDRELSWAHVDEVRVCRTLPVDSRHNAKIDYPALHRMLFGRMR